MTDAKKRRGLLGFYIGLGLAMFLLVGGWLAWKPLRLSYSLHKLRATAASGKAIPIDDKYLGYCLRAAHRGDRAAVHALIDMAEVQVRWERTPSWAFPRWYNLGSTTLRANRNLFFECLEARDDRRCLEVLSAVSRCAEQFDLVYGLARASEGRQRCVQKLRYKFTVLSDQAGDDDKPIGKAALDFLQRRFPEEMAACEKDKEIPVRRTLK